MSTSYSSSVIVGAPMKDLYKTEIKTADKFDKDTGKPFTVPTQQLHGAFGTTKLPPVFFEKKEYGYRERARHDFDFLEKEGLETHLPSCEGYDDPDYLTEHGIVGISLCSGDSDDNGSTTIDAINKAADKVKKALAKHGYTGEIKVYSQVSWG